MSMPEKVPYRNPGDFTKYLNLALTYRIQMKRLSVIIPMFNVEPYVEKCLRSLEAQDIPGNDFEIICINDGSPDNSRGVVIRLQKEFDNIVLIDQENQGVSRARNNGINAASGKYLLFIDPDDFVDRDSFAGILKTSDDNEAQVSFLGFTFLNEDGTVRERILNENLASKIYPGNQAYFLARGDGNTDPDRMCAVLYSTDFLKKNKLFYLADVPYLEDGELIARILGLAERCVFDCHSFYQRTTRPGSATNSGLFHSEKATKGFVKAAGNLKKFQTEQDLNEMQIEFFNQPIVKFVLLAINSSMGWSSVRKFIVTVRALRKLTLRKVKLQGCNWEYRFYGSIYNFSPYVVAMALFIYPRINRIYVTRLSGKGA